MTSDTFDLFQKPERGLFGDNEHARPNDERTGGTPRPASILNHFTLCLHRDDPKDKAILCSQTGDESRAFWMPRSLIEYVGTGKFTKGTRRNGQSVTLAVVTVAMPEQIAKNRGLL